MKCKWNSAEAAQTILTMFQENSDMRVIERVQTAFSAPRVIENRLYHCKDGLTATELATQANCSPSRVTAILDRWEEEGFAERFQLEGDRLIPTSASPKKARSGRRKGKPTCCLSSMRC